MLTRYGNRGVINECSFKFSLVNQPVLGLGAYGPKEGTNLKSVIEGTNDRFEIDIFMWAIGTQSQDGRSQ